MREWIPKGPTALLWDLPLKEVVTRSQRHLPAELRRTKAARVSSLVALAVVHARMENKMARASANSSNYMRGIYLLAYPPHPQLWGCWRENDFIQNSKPSGVQRVLV